MYKETSFRVAYVDGEKGAPWSSLRLVRTHTVTCGPRITTTNSAILVTFGIIKSVHFDQIGLTFKTN
jgi:hypothetical protein